jgi:hypothetical protein
MTIKGTMLSNVETLKDEMIDQRRWELRASISNDHICEHALSHTMSFFISFN